MTRNLGYRLALAVIIISGLLFASISGQGSSEVEIAAVGDMLLDRGVRQQIENNGIKYPFEKVLKTLTATDLTFGNLENPLTDRCDKAAKKYAFRADAAYSSILGNAGFDIVSLANNHSLDCGQIGLDNTFESLDRAGIKYAGAARGNGKSQSVVVVVKGVKVGFTAFTAISPVKPGACYRGVSKAVPESVSREISKLKERSDVVVASFHWGTEYALNVNREQVELARLAIDAGADIVIGHHPHVLQRIELIDRGPGKRKALIAFSLGNFLFDSPVRLNRHVGDSLILKLRVSAEGFLGAEIVPISIEGYRPNLAVGEAQIRIEKRLARISREYGTEIDSNQIVTKGDGIE